MKRLRKIAFLLAIALPFASASCDALHINRRINAVVPGLYVGDEINFLPLTCYLRLTRIDEETYRASRGDGVMIDEVNGNYIDFDFWTIDDETGERTDYVFRDFYNRIKAPGQPVTYNGHVGEREFYFFPGTSRDGVLPPEECFCTVSISEDDENPRIASDLYWVSE